MYIYTHTPRLLSPTVVAHDFGHACQRQFTAFGKLPDIEV